MRADVYLFGAGYAKSRQEAKSLIEEGLVYIDGQKVKKPAEQIDGEISHDVSVLRVEEYVSRGGLKLKAALDAFSLDVSGMRAVDIGASTGGFTDCLLQSGAAFSLAVDAGSGQLAARLNADRRVVSLEKFNARRLAEDDTGAAELLAAAEMSERFDIAVIDVSFISQTYIIPGLNKIIRQGGYYVGLVKPQFEAGRGALSRGGIVKDREHHVFAIKRVAECAAASGFGCLGVIASPILGGDGNAEYLAAFRLGVCGITITDAELRWLTGLKR